MYQMISSVDYPRASSGELQAMVHPQLQFKDYEPLHDGEPMFIKFTGESIPYRGKDTVYPGFINEALMRRRITKNSYDIYLQATTWFGNPVA